jgi:hypothetical protein
VDIIRADSHFHRPPVEITRAMIDFHPTPVEIIRGRHDVHGRSVDIMRPATGGRIFETAPGRTGHQGRGRRFYEPFRGMGGIFSDIRGVA